MIKSNDLTPEERRVYILRHEKKLPWKEVCCRVGYSRSHANRLFRSAVEKLQR